MKNLLVLLFIVFSISVSAQKIGGFYTGTLFNDSTKMVQKYELALSEYRGKISGYSYVTFISNDTFYYGIRKIKATIIGDSLIVKDDKMIVNNFPEAPAKGVGRVITIPIKGQDSLVILNGRWKTNRTKRYYSVPGAIDLTRSEDSAHSPLIAHLKELNIISQINYQNTGAVAETNVKEEPGTEVKIKKKKKKTKTKTETVRIEPKQEKQKTKSEKEAERKYAATMTAKLPYTERKNKILQTVEINSDSLILSFYDNGVVDGDSISVYLNGQAIVSNARLATVAMKKNISIAGLDEINLLLVAENLGTIPPNTGLLTIKDGEDIYQVNFSADLDTNATILIRRKKK